MGANHDLIKKVGEVQQRTDHPEFRAGDTVKVHIKIKEGSKERIQIFEGFILKKNGSGINSTFTVRKESFGIGVEKTFPVNSPIIVKIELVKKGKVRKSRIYYMRSRKGKSARIKPRTV
ncbi:MAG: 50S ribosomal protein L19 [Mycoplasmataceae bacterium]|nr:50S ribosomal protein L19 [Mycoplasmataceae bacterium]